MAAPAVPIDAGSPRAEGDAVAASRPCATAAFWPPSRATVSIAMVRTLVQTLEHGGISAREVLCAGGLSVADLDDGERRIELDRYDALQLRALELSGDEDLGLHMAEGVTLGAFDVMGALVIAAPTLRDVIGVLVRYHRVVSDCPDSELVERGERAFLRYEFPRSHPRCNRIRAEFGLSMLVRLGQPYVGRDARPVRACFQYEAPPDLSEYERIFQGTACFEQDCTGLEFDRRWLDRKQVHPNPTFFRSLEHQAERRLASHVTATSTADRVRARLMAMDPGSRPTIEEVARQLGTSTRSLRRRLRVENVSFSALAEQTLVVFAREALDDTTRSIQEVAAAMGFSEPSAFHRAFKRWTGLTPGQYRQRRPGSEPPHAPPDRPSGEES